MRAGVHSRAPSLVPLSTTDHKEEAKAQELQLTFMCGNHVAIIYMKLTISFCQQDHGIYGGAGEIFEDVAQRMSLLPLFSDLFAVLTAEIKLTKTNEGT
eukprot:3350644-Amphidinium_carterae.1